MSLAPSSCLADECKLCAGEAPHGRQAGLFAGMAVLARRLTSVFTPYFKQALDLLVAALASEAPASEEQPKKKRRKSKDSQAPQSPAAERLTLQVS